MRKWVCGLLMLASALTARSQSLLSGSVLNPDGSGFSGRLIFTLAQNAAANTLSPCTGPALVMPNVPIVVTVSAGSLVSPPTLLASTCTLPVGIPYNVTAIDMNGNTVFNDQWLVTGSTFDVGTASSSSNIPVVSYKGPWTAFNTYLVGDLVQYGSPSEIYVSLLSNNVGNSPATATTYWQALSASGGGSMTWPSGAGIPNYSGSSSWGTTYSASHTIPANFISTLNQNTTGTAANITATSNSTLTTLSALSLPYSQLTGTPTVVSPIGTSDVTGRSTSQTTTTLVASAPGAAAYRISYYADQSGTCTTGSNGVLFSFQWTDATHARTVNSIPLALASSQSASLGSIQGVIPVYADNATAITYTSTINGSCTTGTSTYDVHVIVENL